MTDARDHRLLDALLDSWDRNTTILINLLRAIPESVLDAKPIKISRANGRLDRAFFEVAPDGLCYMYRAGDRSSAARV